MTPSVPSPCPSIQRTCSDRQSTAIFAETFNKSTSSTTSLLTTLKQGKSLITFCNIFIINAVYFISSYAYSGRPVIIKDALANWTAMEMFSYEFFRELYTKDSISSRSRRCQFFPYKSGFHSLNEALTMSKERQLTPWYFGWSNCDSETADVLRHHYSRPYFLPELSESSRTDWIFMGTAGLGAHMHVRS